jgi:hypothetical protein
LVMFLPAFFIYSSCLPPSSVVPMDRSNFDLRCFGAEAPTKIRSMTARLKSCPSRF